MNIDFTALTKLLTPISPHELSGPSFIPSLFVFLITVLLYLAGIVVVFAILYGGIMYITAVGDESKAAKGRNSILNGVIGLVIVMLSLIVVQILKQVVGAI